MPEVPGFRVGRLIARDRLGPIHEATQLGLERRVALRLLDGDPTLGGRLRRLRWPEHERVADLYAAGAWPGGFYVARQLVEGPRFADLSRRRARVVLRDVADALRAAHAEGVTHGAIGPDAVLVDGDGRGVLADFGLAPGATSPEDDRRALAALEATFGARRPDLRLVAVAAAAAGVVILAFALRGGEPAAPPPTLPGAEVLGSALLPTPAIQTLDCDGRTRSGASPACTLVQTRLPGRRLAARRAGVVRRWRVAGAQGELALAVLRRRGRVFEAVRRTEPVDVDGGGGGAIPAAVEIAAGDVLGVELTPGAGIGVRSGVSGATTAQWVGPLAVEPRRPDDGPSLAGELLLRVEVEPQATVRPPGLLEGRAAATAPAGREVGRARVDLADGRRRTVVVVVTDGHVAVDLLAGSRRVARLPVAAAEPRGRLEALRTLGRQLLLLRWRNADGRGVRREYAVLGDGLRLRR